MTEIELYKNGYLIKGHTRPDICGELSMFAWVVSTLITNMGGGDYYASPFDGSDAGYGHLVINHESDTANQIFSIAAQMIPMWAEKFGWIDGGYVQIIVKDEILSVPENFKQLHNISA